VCTCSTANEVSPQVAAADAVAAAAAAAAAAAEIQETKLP